MDKGNNSNNLRMTELGLTTPSTNNLVLTTDEFIGKNPPSTPIFGDLLDFPGLGYNEKQIQFPTTVVDLGPRDSFINEICCSGDDSDFGSYYTDQLKMVCLL